ncbi:helix-turn-helix domain-containing protein [Myroides marinus]|uniref:helix-turn-helix domain-containing protein n=1 Tax=Myroides marinus TaxID=703342 RepID=UPI002574ACBA|nr:helix-turn-helix domain-containing protein [Myroides marinus]MDM1347633.1 AraC family transcriptional regulator [Myroides marinus]MDM1355944.1 AraC family transcriptional regulator [Myroides marinus]MDM1363105.1 AraC family transcriptional regulator [Myroides marinus]MDM1405225.1 AraC family transcriptional regulator [Myroides marinus]
MTKIKRITPTDFRGEYMSAMSADFAILKTPIQIHDIAKTSGFIQVPTPLHRPEFNFIVHITKGTALQQVDANDIAIKENEILFVRQGNVTSLKEVSADAAGYIILFEDQILNQILSKQELIKLFSVNVVINLPNLDSLWLNSLFELLNTELYQAEPNLGICYSLFQAGLQKVFVSSTALNKNVNRSAEITFLFKELVYKYYIEQKSVLFYANELSVSENYLHRCIKECIGESPKEWINKVSILQSQLLLRDLTKSISEVAFELNYGDPSYFGRLFKKIVGSTPSEYRTSITQDLSE